MAEWPVRCFLSEEMRTVVKENQLTIVSDGGGEDGLNDGGVKVHHHCLWQVEFLQLPQEVHPLMCLFGEGDDV